MRRLLPLLALLVLALPAAGHAAPEPRPFETRALHDHNDDGDLELAATVHGFDTIALDVRPAHWQGDDVLVLRFILNGGCNEEASAAVACPELRLVTTFMADGAERSVELRAPAGRDVWEGDGVRFVGPEHLGDGTRFAIEQWVPSVDLDVAAGSTLTDFFVTGYAGDTEADSMPQGPVPQAPDPLEAAYSIDSYVLEAPDFYLNAGVDEDAVSPGATITLSITNGLVTPQNVTLDTLAGAATFEPATLSLAPGGTGDTAVTLTAAGPVTLRALSDLGGVATINVTVNDAPVVAGDNVTAAVAAGGTFSHTFSTAGTFSYHDHHSGANGTIVVQESGASAETHVVRFDGAFDPAHLTIRSGDTVEWRNGVGELMLMGSMRTGDHGDHEHGAPALGPAFALAALAVLVRRR